MEATRQQIVPLTSVRIFAAVFVVIYHYGRNVWPFAEGWLHRVMSCAGSSVAFFFFLSGYILAHAYRGYDWQAPGKLGKYYAARVARIYPVYFAALAATFLLEGSGVYWDRISAVDAAVTLQVHLGLLQSWLPDYVYRLNVPGWSLSVEASFYLLFPLVVSRLMSLRRSAALAGFCGIYIVSQSVLALARCVVWKDWFMSSEMIHHLLMYHPLVYWPVFLMGMLSFRFMEAVPGKSALAPAAMGGLSVLAVGGMGLLSYWADERLNYSIHVGMLAPLYGLLIYSLREPRNGLARVLSTRWLSYFGEASYSVYILQLPLYLVWLRLGMSPEGSGWVFCLYLASLLAISGLLFRWYETPLRRWIRGAAARG